jgi:hypothetical protein
LIVSVQSGGADGKENSVRQIKERRKRGFIAGGLIVSVQSGEAYGKENSGRQVK